MSDLDLELADESPEALIALFELYRNWALILELVSAVAAAFLLRSP